MGSTEEHNVIARQHRVSRIDVIVVFFIEPQISERRTPGTWQDEISIAHITPILLCAEAHYEDG